MYKPSILSIILANIAENNDILKQNT